MFEDRQRAGAGRHPGIGTQHREIGLPAVELGQRLRVVGIGNDLEPQFRIVVLEHGGELGGEAGLEAVGIADSEHQRFGIP